MNNGLIIKKENVFVRIKNFFKRLFKKECIVILQGEEEKISNYNKEKTEILELYNKLISGEIKENQIPQKYKEKIKELLKEEIKMHEKTLNEIKSECGVIKFQIKSNNKLIENHGN